MSSPLMDPRLADCRRLFLRNYVVDANIGIHADRAGVEDELRALALQAAASGLRSVVIDTQRNFLSQGAAKNLAAWLGGEYLYLPGASGAAIAAAAQSAA